MWIGQIVGIFGRRITWSGWLRRNRGRIHFACIAQSFPWFGSDGYYKLWARAIAVSLSDAFPSDALAGTDDDALGFDTCHNTCISKSSKAKRNEGKQIFAPPR